MGVESVRRIVCLREGWGVEDSRKSSVCQESAARSEQEGELPRLSPRGGSGKGCGFHPPGRWKQASRRAVSPAW